MATTSKTYTANKIKQLIDLNGDSTNFDVTFKATSKSGTPFQILVVDQTTLDNNPSLEYKSVDQGQISGNIVQDKNVYQNYFLVLKAEKPTEIEIEITKKDIAPAPTPIPPQKPSSSPSSKKPIPWLKILVVVGVVVLGGYVLYVLSQKKTDGTGGRGGGGTDGGTGGSGGGVVGESAYVFSPVASQRSSPDRACSSPSPVSSVGSLGGTGNALLDRLKSLNIK